MRYLPHTPEQIESMLKRIGVPSIDALFAPIPESVRMKEPLGIGPGLDEQRLMAHLESLADRNTGTRALSFLGGGMYDHHIPPLVDQLLLRGEFYTAYTPYQAEVAQGTLQAIFEFQTIVSELFGLPVANASMYDASSAAAEAILMARRLTKKHRILVSAGLHPEDLEVMHAYLQGLPGGLEAIDVVPLAADGTTAPIVIGEDVAAVVVGYPNFYGVVEDVKKLADSAHAKGALLVTVTHEAYALAVIESPGALGVDIAVGEGQSVALPPQGGGPGVGLFACRDARDYLQQIPGRLCGETVDKHGERGYVLTLSTREQHIRRDRATSNICTNHSLCALAMAIRMSLLGKVGFVQVAEQCLAKAEHLKQALVATGKWELPYSGLTFNEFVIRSKSSAVAPLLKKLEGDGIIAGVPLSRFAATKSADRDVLVAVTEKHSRADLDRLVSALGE